MYMLYNMWGQNVRPLRTKSNKNYFQQQQYPSSADHDEYEQDTLKCPQGKVKAEEITFSYSSPKLKSG